MFFVIKPIKSSKGKDMGKILLEQIQMFLGTTLKPSLTQYGYILKFLTIEHL